MSSWLLVLNWNGKGDTLALLESLRQANLTDTTVLVVDNGSTDGSVDAVRCAHPWVEILETGENLGFAGGNNRGIAYAMRHGANVIGVINNDTTVSPGFWEPLVSAAEEDELAVSPDIRFAASANESWFFGSTISSKEGWVRHLQPFEQPSHDKRRESITLTGCCVVASVATWRRVGMFDEGLFLIFEDVDWSFRARARGIRLHLEPRSVIQHKVSQSFQGPTSGLGLYYFCRNGLVVAARWMGFPATANFAYRHVVRPGVSNLLRKRPGAYQDLLIRFVALTSAASPRKGRAGRIVSRLASATSTR